jgi:hypothetical protein
LGNDITVIAPIMAAMASRNSLLDACATMKSIPKTHTSLISGTTLCRNVRGLGTYEVYGTDDMVNIDVMMRSDAFPEACTRVVRLVRVVPATGRRNARRPSTLPCKDRRAIAFFDPLIAIFIVIYMLYLMAILYQ